MTQRTYRLMKTHETKPRQPGTFWKHEFIREGRGSQARLRIVSVGKYEAMTEVIAADNPEHVGKQMRLYRGKEPVRSMPASWLPHLVPGTELVIGVLSGKFMPRVQCIDIQPADPAAINEESA